jgi:hypothetical protein
MIDQAFDDTVEAQAIPSTMPPTFATLALSAGEHYMQVSKWLGHSSLRADANHLRRLHSRGRTGGAETGFDEIVADPKAQQVGVDVTPCSYPHS